ncbi:hypothetical protein [Pseudomonas sp. R5(2019)]|uniref:hypothetical protein n=1 Tax=Pseudomonas sp. R5(2019) TaxID=2697566 RepID=UPI0014124F04|nr:hypothetical protein [Pseudomonas sp. R5(2019)]NBA95650.1 hypothetical protein [Pseudomonas sp. R5(2019)]
MLESILTSAFVSTLLLGAVGWLGKIWINRVREIDRVKYESEIISMKQKVDFSFHTNKSVFEKELIACTETWSALLKLTSEVLYIKRDFDGGEDVEAQIIICYQQHLKTHDLIYNNAPFIPKNIRDGFIQSAIALQDIYKKSQKISRELDSYELPFSFFDAQYKDAADKIVELEELIRSRYVINL